MFFIRLTVTREKKKGRKRGEKKIFNMVPV